MCLTRPEKFKIDEQVGYKWLLKYDSSHGDIYQGICHWDNNYRLGRWEQANPRTIAFGEDREGDYQSGFHIFLDENEAKSSEWAEGDPDYIGKLTLCKVEFEDFFTGRGDGLEDDSRQVVAQRMKIIGEVKL